MSKITKSEIEYGQRQKPAIYLITNNINGKLYVGQAVNFSKRQSRHRRSVNVDSSSKRPLVSAFKKYGFENFTFSILESPAIQDLTEREQFWMDKLNVCNRAVGYNAAPAAGSPYGFKHSQETRNKVSKAGIGRVLSDETKKRMSIARMGIVVSEETRRKISAAKKGTRNPTKRGRAVEQLCLLTGSVISAFGSISRAHREVRGGVSPILAVCNGKRLQAGGFGWRFQCPA